MTIGAAPGPRWLGEAAQAGLATALAVVLLPVGWTSVREGGLAAGWVWALLVALVALHAAVFATYRFPLPSYAVGGLAMLVLVAGPDLAGPTALAAGTDYAPVLLPSSLCFFVLLYAVSSRSPRPWPTAALVGGLVGCLLTVVRLWGLGGVALEGWAWWLLLAFATVGSTLAAWALGRFRATRAEWVAQLAEQGAADERRRIAREMHDVVAHSLAVVVSHAEAGRMVVDASPDRAPEILDTIATTGREALTEMRGLLGILRDGSPAAGGTRSGAAGVDPLPAPGDRPPATAPQPGLGDVTTLVDGVRRAGLRVELDADHPPHVPPAVGLTAYRVVQEALTNVARHAGPGASARVRIERSAEGLHVVVTDDGTGAATAGTAGTAGRGLTGMRERVEAVGGTLAVGPATPEGRGWRVDARMPA